MWLTIPYPISTNRYWRNYRGYVTVSSEAKRYRQDIQWLAQAAGIKPIEGRVEVNVRVYPHQPKDWMKRAEADPDWWLKVRCIDVDNALKVVLDAFQGIAYADDKQVHRVSVERMKPDEKQERAEVLIRSLKEV